MEEKIIYFRTPGKENTEKTLILARDTALKKGIKTVALASIRGQSARKAIDIFKGTKINLVIVGCNGCNGCPHFPEDLKIEIKKEGFHFTLAPENSIPYPQAAQLAYRRICEGMKVCVHIAMSLAEQEIVKAGEEIIAIAGTGWKGYEKGGGADTAVIIESQKSKDFFNYQSLYEHKLNGRKIKEIICRPR